MKKLFRVILMLAKLFIIPLAVWLLNALIFVGANSQRKSTLKEQVYEWRHGDIRYIVAGQGKPLLLVHHPGSSLDEWKSSLSALSKHHRVYALDLIGFGYSDKPGINYSSYLYVMLLNDFIRDIIKQKANIVATGLSGAFTVMAYAFAPERYAKMLLIAPTGVGSSGSMPKKENLWKKWLFESPLIGTSIFNALCSRLSLGWLFKNRCFYDPAVIPGDFVDVCYHAQHFGGANARLATAALLSGFLHVNIESKLALLKIPTHIIWGEGNKLNPIRNFDVIEEKNPAIGLTVFEKTGALPHIENPKAFCRECIQFFRETPPLL